jgi:hypothetical protein
MTEKIPNLCVWGMRRLKLAHFAHTLFLAGDFSTSELGCLGLASIVQMLAECPHTLVQTAAHCHTSLNYFDDMTFCLRHSHVQEMLLVLGLLDAGSSPRMLHLGQPTKE